MWLTRPRAPEKSGTRPRSWVERMPLHVNVEKTLKPGSGLICAVWRCPSVLRKAISSGMLGVAIVTWSM